MNRSFGNLFSLFSLARLFQDLNLQFEKKYDLSLTQWLVLWTLKDLPGCTALKLAQSLSMQPSSLSQILKRLERKKLIHITKDPQDSRKKILSLSRRGMNEVEVLASQLKPQLRRLNISIPTHAILGLESLLKDSSAK